MPEYQSVLWGALLSAALTSCSQDPSPDGATDNSVDVTAASRALEKAALETGAITDVRSVDPVGVYQRSHEAGTDSICIGRGLGAALPFAVSFAFAEQEYCAGTGEAKRTGDSVIFRFKRADGCIIVARFDGDMIALPGAVDARCQALCTERGSMAGIALPRIASGTNAAVRDRTGGALCPEN